jgi:integrase
MPTRLPNAELRRREHLTEAEVERIIEAAKGNRWGLRDAMIILVAYRHGLRASELVDLRWDQVDFRTATLHVREEDERCQLSIPAAGHGDTAIPECAKIAGFQIQRRN